ncbi:MAG: hypothetical protein AABX72_00300 [Nanoarchaeota archaeon]
MKKRVLVVICLLLLITPSYAAVDSIYEYLKKMDQGYAVVLGDQGKSGDSFAATDVIIALKKHLSLDIDPVIEDETLESVSKILIGHPCDNSFIQLSCEQWPYDEGVAIIKVMGNDLIIAGSTVDDTRRAAKIIANFKNYEELKQTKEILVLGDTLKVADLTFQQVKKESEFVCGDQVCEIGEKIFCSTDCAQLSCYQLCKNKNFIDATCRDLPSNVNLPACGESEENQGLGYCSNQKACCCKETENEEEILQTEKDVEEQEEEHLPIWLIIWRWFKELFSVIF